MLQRFGTPSKMDTAPHGELCKVFHGPETIEIFFQLSHDEENPAWISMGNFSPDACDEYIHDSIKKRLLSQQ